MSYKLHIHLMRGTNLRASDIGGTSDPYVVFEIGKEKKSSRVVQKTVNPVWDEHVEITVGDPARDFVHMTVFDKDRFNKDDSLGHCKFSLTNCRVNTNYEVTLLLHETGKKPDQGEITLSFRPEGFGRTY